MKKILIEQIIFLNQKSISLAEFQKRETELKNAQIALNAAKTQVSSSEATINALRSSNREYKSKY